MRPLALSVSSMLTSPPSIAAVYSCETTTASPPPTPPDGGGGGGGEDVVGAGVEVFVTLNTLCGLEAAARRGSPGSWGGGGGGREAAVRTMVLSGHFAQIPVVETRRRRALAVGRKGAAGRRSGSDAGKLDAWCVSGQGWSLVGVKGENYRNCHHFISWEGATVAQGAYVQKLQGDVCLPTGYQKGRRGFLFNPSLAVCDVLPTDVSVARSKNSRTQEKIDDMLQPSTVKLPFTSESPFTKSFRMPSALRLMGVHDNMGYTELSRNRSEGLNDEATAGVDDIVINALDSITSMQSSGFHHNQRAMFPSATQRLQVTHKAKSEMLLRHCSSWTQLDDNEENRALIDGQVIVASFRLGPLARQHCTLTLRKNVITNGVATPFHQVLSWLCQKRDYFTAASVALNLLNDLEAVRDLRACPSSTEENDERSYLEGLLDGIIPLEGNDFFSTGETQESKKRTAPTLLVESGFGLPTSPEKTLHTPSTITSLADMAVGCLIRGGTGMSVTLEGFLGRNIYYDASRACLMLAATAANAVSDYNEMRVMSQHSPASEKSMFQCEHPIENVLWPIRCLFKIAVTRDCMSTALLLLNGTIPNELRCLENHGGYGVSLDAPPPSLHLCKSIISMIIASSTSAAGYLLSLTDDDSHKRYWESLGYDTQLELSMISIRGKYPLLREAEVRAWSLQQISSNIAALSTPAEASVALSSKWLKEMCTACLRNAGCNVEKLWPYDYIDPTAAVPSISDEQNDGILRRQEELKLIHDSLACSPGSGGIDFDLIIPSLLILKKRPSEWSDRVPETTQSLLDAICDLAGRQTVEEPSFAFDGVTVMKQCASAENVLAAANLIGGEDGLVLHCADVLITSLGISMKQAESFLLKKGVLMGENFTGQSDNGECSESTFRLTDGHCYLLWLIEEHVLSVTTFGQFKPSNIRHGIDPVFASQVCLRAWLCLTKNQGVSGSTWLVSWFRRKLGMCEEGSISNKRLACAALCRALIWPDDTDLVDWNNSEANRSPVLAEALGLDCKFLVGLAQASCGLIEAIPVSVAQEVLNNQNDSDDVVFPGRTIQV